jgi:hypothetical protein
MKDGEKGEKDRWETEYNPGPKNVVLIQENWGVFSSGERACLGKGSLLVR